MLSLVSQYYITCMTKTMFFFVTPRFLNLFIVIIITNVFYFCNNTYINLLGLLIVIFNKFLQAHCILYDVPTLYIYNNILLSSLFLLLLLYCITGYNLLYIYIIHYTLIFINEYKINIY